MAISFSMVRFMVTIIRKHAVAKDQTQSATKKPAEQATTGTIARATPMPSTAHLHTTFLCMLAVGMQPASTVALASI